MIKKHLAVYLYFAVILSIIFFAIYKEGEKNKEVFQICLKTGSIQECKELLK